MHLTKVATTLKIWIDITGRDGGIDGDESTLAELYSMEDVNDQLINSGKKIAVVMKGMEAVKPNKEVVSKTVKIGREKCLDLQEW